MKNFALIGAAGYIAPRHMQAITEFAVRPPRNQDATSRLFAQTALLATESCAISIF